MAYLNFALSVTLNGIVLSLIGVLIEKVLIKYGLVRGDTISVILGCFFISLVWQLVDINRATHWIFWYAAGVLAPISLNRGDFINSLTKGVWWWKSER